MLPSAVQRYLGQTNRGARRVDISAVSGGRSLNPLNRRSAALGDASVISQACLTSGNLDVTRNQQWEASWHDGGN